MLLPNFGQLCTRLMHSSWEQEMSISKLMNLTADQDLKGGQQ